MSTFKQQKKSSKANSQVKEDLRDEVSGHLRYLIAFSLPIAKKALREYNRPILKRA